MAVSKRYAKIVTFTVEGGGNFPVDMLRYDACYPATEKDSYLMYVDGFDLGIRKVTLKHRVLKEENLDGYPTLMRWNSFTWSVIPTSINYDN